MRLGIIGTGRMAADMAQAANAVPELGVAAVMSRDVARAQKFCQTFAPTAQAFDNFAAFAGAIDAVYIASPPAQHAEMIEAAIALKIPVLCEKPFTPSAAAVKTLIAKAQAADVLVMEAIWTLALPAYRAMQNLVDTKLKSCHGALLQFDFSYPLAATTGTHYLTAETGGVLLDRAVYGYAAAIRLLGPVHSQEAKVTRNQDGIDTSATLRLTHANENTSLITLSFDNVGANRLDLATSAGLAQLGPSSLAAETLHWQPKEEASAAKSKPGLKARLKAMPLVRAVHAKTRSRGNFLSYGASQYSPILQEFKNCVTQGKKDSALVPLSLTQRIAELTQDARGTIQKNNNA